MHGQFEDQSGSDEDYQDRFYFRNFMKCQQCQNKILIELKYVPQFLMTLVTIEHWVVWYFCYFQSQDIENERFGIVWHRIHCRYRSMNSLISNLGECYTLMRLLHSPMDFDGLKWSETSKNLRNGKLSISRRPPIPSLSHNSLWRPRTGILEKSRLRS